MGDSSFYDWLVNEKKLTHYAAKDVQSRCNRVCKLLGSETINADSILALSSNKEFSEYSKFVKSQLKRAVKLFEEYQNSK